MSIIAFSKYLSYMVGGAEKSTYELLVQEYQQGQGICLISFDNVGDFGAKNKKISFPKDWDIEYIHDTFKFRKFFYWEYVLNRKKLGDFFKKLRVDSCLYTYGMYAPIAVNNFIGNSKLFIRCEADLGINRNYHHGVKKILKYIYMLVEFPAFYIYKKDLVRAISASNVVCNSKYISGELREIYNKDSIISYPFIDEIRLKIEYQKALEKHTEKKFIVFVGDAVIKGLKIAEKLANSMPERQFMFFSRFVNTASTKKNVTWMPWQKNEVDIYKYARVVIVPSIWNEAYGRVSREAFILGIPVLVSNIGGLPESVNENKSCIIEDYQNVEKWKERLETLI